MQKSEEKNAVNLSPPSNLHTFNSSQKKFLSRYSGNGTEQMGLLVESASLFDNGNWTLTMRNNGSTAIADGIIAQVNSPDARMLART